MSAGRGGPSAQAPRPAVFAGVQQAVPLSRYTSLRIGGPAAELLEVRSLEALAEAVSWARRNGRPFYVLGGGTNVLIDDAGLGCLVLVNRAEDLLAVEGECIRAASGLSLSAVVACAAAAGLGGFEFAAGIPGSLGGAIVGNAGAWGESIGDVLDEITVVDVRGERRTLLPAQCDFAYRDSRLKQSGDVVLCAALHLHAGDPLQVRRRIDEILASRAARLPAPEVATAGSFFRNIQPTSAAERRVAAGYYLEQAGAKTLRVGDAAVSDKHANIVVNAGGATARDVLALTAEMQRRVRERFQINLVPEVRYVPPDARA